MILPDKTMELVIKGFLSTRFTKKEVINSRAALELDTYTYSDPNIEEDSALSIGAIKKFVLLTTEGPDIVVTLTKETDTFDIKVNRMLLISDAFDEVIIRNTSTVADTAQRVRCLWS